MNDYHIEIHIPAPVDKWHKLCGFSSMRRAYAMGAWAMLKAHYNQTHRHRLLKGNEVIDQHDFARVRVNSPAAPEKPVRDPSPNEYDAILESAIQSYRHWSRGIKGQAITRMDLPEFWAIVATLKWANDQLQSNRQP